VKPRVYLETTIVGYLTARPLRTVLGAAHQQVTIDWWDKRRRDFDLVVSELVLREAEAGDPEAARARIAKLEGIPRLALTDDVLRLGGEFVDHALLPQKAAEDALHIAVATIHAVDFLLTWNCTHIANPQIQIRLAEYLQGKDLFLPFICTPEELLGGEE
jgi:hypothetical protein